MAHLITTDRRDDYSHHQTDATRRGPTISDVDYFWGNSPASTQPFRFGSRISKPSPVGHPASRRRTERRSAARPQTSPTRFTALPRHHNAPERVGLPGG